MGDVCTAVLSPVLPVSVMVSVPDAIDSKEPLRLLNTNSVAMFAALNVMLLKSALDRFLSAVFPAGPNRQLFGVLQLHPLALEMPMHQFVVPAPCMVTNRFRFCLILSLFANPMWP